MPRHLGIDPGSVSPSGAVFQALNGAKGNIIAVFDIPMTGDEKRRRVDVLGFVDLIQKYGVNFVTLELVNAMPSIPDAQGNRRGMGATSAFKFGAAFGDLRTTVRLCGFEPRFVVPRVWKKHFGLIGSDKEQSRLLAIELFPQIADDLKLKKWEGRAEAALLARYGASVS